MSHFDAVIVGGGLVGTGLFIALAQTSLEIAIIDQKNKLTIDKRIFALNDNSCNLLKNLDVWNDVAPYATKIKQVHVSRKGHFGSMRIDSEDLNLAELGYVIPAFQIEKALTKKMEQIANVTIFKPAQLVSIESENNYHKLVLKKNEETLSITTNLIFGADGINSTVRQLLNFTTTHFDYKQLALVAKLSPSEAHHSIAYERFVTNGAIALLPLKDNQCALIWTGPTKEMEYLSSLSDADFLANVQKQFGYKLGRFKNLKTRYCYPLHSVKATECVKNNAVLLGSAAHHMHPIAAQGYNLALLEVATIIEGMLEKKGKEEMLNERNLKNILARIMPNQRLSIDTSHRLARVFQQETLNSSIIFSIGMLMFDLVTPLKKSLVKKLMGKNNWMPHLLLSTET